MNQLATLLVFVPILADTGLTLIRRTWMGHHPFVPHCDFYYQRMILAGTPQWLVLLLLRAPLAVRSETGPLFPLSSLEFQR